MATVIRPFSFREFLVGGDFPEAQGLAPTLRIELLQGYVDTVLFRDVVERYDISQVAALRWLVRHFLRSPAGSFSVHRLHQDMKAQGHGVARDLVHAMLGHLTDAFLLSTVSLETTVFNELERRGAEVGYVKTEEGLEVDFLVRYPADGEELIQVCVDPSDEATLARELRALTSAGKEHRRAQRRLLVLDHDAVPRTVAPGVLVQPAYEWLLALPAEE